MYELMWKTELCNAFIHFGIKCNLCLSYPLLALLLGGRRGHNVSTDLIRHLWEVYHGRPIQNRELTCTKERRLIIKTYRRKKKRVIVVGAG